MGLDSRKIARQGKTGKKVTAHKGFALCCSAWGIGEGRQEGETGGGGGGGRCNEGGEGVYLNGKENVFSLLSPPPSSSLPGATTTVGDRQGSRHFPGVAHFHQISSHHTSRRHGQCLRV